MQTPTSGTRLQRWLALALMWTLVLGQTMQQAIAATALADVPIASKVTAKPNIVYTVDDSGSMALNYIPDFSSLGGIAASWFCRYSFSRGTYNCPANYNTGFPYSWDPPFWSADWNHMMYNPNVNYLPPLKADGTALTYSIGTVTDINGNQINLKKVQSDPFLSAATLVDLTALVQVPLYCNSDWPLDTSIGTNGEYQAGKGQDCRINGTKYDAIGVAPGVSADYNYPWHVVANTPNDPAYYFQGQSTGSPAKTLWCDTTSAGWPSSTCAWYCKTGVAIKTVVPQTWNKTGPFNSCCSASGSPYGGCTANTGYTPNGCNTNYLYCSPGLGSPPECIGGCACNATQVGNTGTCSYVDPNTGSTVMNGTATCTSGINCVATCASVNITTGCTLGGTLSNQCACPAGNASCACNSLLNGQAAGGTTLLQDANLANGGTGTTCRHNNQAYGATPAGPVTYSTVGLGGMKPWNTAISSGCPTFPGNANIPRHYYTISSVQFCDSINPVGVNNQWRGFGTGVCKNKNDFATYANVKYGTFTRVDLVNDGRTFAYSDALGNPLPPRTYAQEAINYGNWFAYYRTRLLAAKTTSSIAFSFLDNTYRVGFQNLGDEPSPTYGLGNPITWVDVNDFQGTAVGTTRGDFYNALFNLKAPATTKTPTASAMLRIGNLFKTGGAGGLPPEVNPLPATAKDPITLSCQSNFHILFTDGFTNQIAKPAVVGNVDNKAQAWDASIVDILPDNVMPNLRPPTLATGAAWPHPFDESGAPAVPDSLADISLYYWMHDLRPAMKNDVQAWPGKGGNDLNPVRDMAWWQHLSFSAISFGSDGILDASDPGNVMTALTNGTATWPSTLTLPATPNPFTPNNPGKNPGATAADDLWHAAVNSRGTFVYAQSPIDVGMGLSNILASISNQRKSRAGAAFSGQVLDATNNIIYETTIEPGWAGDVLKVQIDPKSGAEVATKWQANVQLAAQLKPTVDGDEPWFTNRRVVTLNPVSNKGVPFEYANLAPAQLSSLASDPLQQKKMIAYLRGGTTWGAAPTTPIEGAKFGQFRVRSGALGDVSNAQAAIVEAPSRPYLDSNDPGYSAFVKTQAGRATRVFAAANDGMLHSFDAATGNEVFAYVPSALMRGIAGAPATQDVTGLGALTYQDGGIPIFHHHFYVDSTPKAADVDFNNGAGSPDWHTIVVGGLGKGGNTYYALDVTSASAADETAAAAKVMWEWRNPDNDDDTVNNHKLVASPGYSYGRPVIVKTRAYGWTVIVTAGYNNKSGLGKLYFLDAKTGTLLKTMATTAGTPGNPSGLAQIHAFVKDYRNQIAEQVYGGDLLGNLWRFDVSSANPASWKVDLFAQLKDSANAPQPVTTAPQIEIDLNNGINRYVFIGTGQLLDTSDLSVPSPPQQETMYAIRDGTLATYLTAGLPIQPRATMDPINVDGVSAIVGGAPNGWFHDLPSTPPTAERIVVDVQADVNVAAYVGTQAPNDPCIISLPASLYARDFTSGKSLLESGGVPVASATLPEGAVGGTLVGRVDPVTGVQSLGWLISKEVPGSAPYDIINPVSGPGNRLSWRLLTGQ